MSDTHLHNHLARALAQDLADALRGKPYPNAKTDGAMIDSCDLLAHSVLWRCQRDFTINRTRAYIDWYNGTRAIAEWLLESHSPAIFRYLQIATDLDDSLRLPRNYRTPLERKTRIALIKQYQYTCQYCGGTGNKINGPDGQKWHVDHIIPCSAGGSDNIENLTLACATCNMNKGVSLGWIPQGQPERT